MLRIKKDWPEWFADIFRALRGSGFDYKFSYRSDSNLVFSKKKKVDPLYRVEVHVPWVWRGAGKNGPEPRGIVTVQIHDQVRETVVYQREFRPGSQLDERVVTSARANYTRTVRRPACPDCAQPTAIKKDVKGWVNICTRNSEHTPVDFDYGVPFKCRNRLARERRARFYRTHRAAARHKRAKPQETEVI